MPTTTMTKPSLAMKASQNDVRIRRGLIMSKIRRAKTNHCNIATSFGEARLAVLVLLLLLGQVASFSGFQASNARRVPSSGREAGPKATTPPRSKSLPRRPRQRQQRHPSDDAGARLGALPISVESLGGFYETAPYQSAFLTCAVKASAADIVAQVRQQLSDVGGDAKSGGAIRRSDDGGADGGEGWAGGIDIAYSRNLAFVLYGGLYQGCAQQFLYNTLFPQMFGYGTDPIVVATKVLFDMAVISPLLCLPISYLIKAAIYGQDPIRCGLESYAEDVREKGLLQKYCSIWMPVQSLTFSVVPEQFRIVFIAAVSFFWLIILSSISGGRPVPAATSEGEN